MKRLLAAALLLTSCTMQEASSAQPDVTFSVSEGSNMTDTTAKTQLSEDSVRFYKYWKERYVRRDKYTDEPQYYVLYSTEEFSGDDPVPVTVSEAHGYGMLITVSAAYADSEAKALFDGMYRFYMAHRSGIGHYLMAWQQSDDGKRLIETNGADSATDGDMDIAYSLLMADSVWGSGGEINYREAAVNIINDIMTYEVNSTDWMLRLGDWTYGIEEGNKFFSVTRSSDLIMQYMPVFAKVTGDDRWMKVYDTSCQIIREMTDEYGTGIIPDFIIKKDGRYVPAPANLLESENDGNYYYNACRVPWRVGMDGIINNNKDAVHFSEKINSFIVKKTGGDPQKIMAGYTPQGEEVSDWNDLSFDSPFMLTAKCAGDTKWHDDIRAMCLDYGDDVYYGDSITMLCLIVDDGCWIIPE